MPASLLTPFVGAAGVDRLASGAASARTFTGTMFWKIPGQQEAAQAANFLMRQAWFSQQHLKYKQLPDINTLIQEMKDLECFKQLHNTKTAKQTIRKVLTDWSNFKKALTAYSKDRSKFIRCPKPPHYKKKMAQVIFYNETIFGGQSKNKKLTSLTATNNCFSVPCREGYKQVVITPKAFGFVIEVQYESKEQKKAKNRRKQRSARTKLLP